MRSSFGVELFPLGWLGRNLQLVALSAAPHLVKDVAENEVVFSSEQDFIELLIQGYELAASLLEQGLVKPPRLYGNDYKPLDDIMKGIRGRKLKKEERRWDIALRLIIDGLREGGEIPDEKVVPLTLMAASKFEYLRRMMGPIKPENVELKKFSPHAIILALIGGLLAKIGSLDRDAIYLVAHDEAGLSDLEAFSELYASLVLPGSDSRLPVLGRLLGGKIAAGVRKLPLSLDTMILLYAAALVGEALDVEPGELCGLSDRLNQVVLASVSEGGNRPIVKEFLALGISEPLCRLGSRPLVSLASLLSRALSTGLCGSGNDQNDPGSTAVGHCFSKLFLYTVTDNTIYLYDCARLLRGAASSQQCQSSGASTWLLRAAEHLARLVSYPLSPHPAFTEE